MLVPQTLQSVILKQRASPLNWSPALLLQSRHRKNTSKAAHRAFISASTHKAPRTTASLNTPKPDERRPKGLITKDRGSGNQLIPKTEEWYRYYIRLLKPIRYGKPLNAYRLLESGDLQSRLSEDLRGDPLAVFDNAGEGQSGIDTINDCLELFIARIYAQCSSVSEARGRYLTDNPGRKAMEWILKTTERRRLEACTTVRFTSALTHCLVGQNDTSSLWELMMYHAPKSAFTSKSYAPATTLALIRRWRGTILYGALDAKVFWSAKSDPFEDAVGMIINTWKSNSRQSVENRVSVSRALMWMMKMPFRGSLQNPKHHEFLCDAIRVINHAGNDFDLAKMAMIHPTKPSPDGMLRLLRTDTPEAQLPPRARSVFHQADVDRLASKNLQLMMLQLAQLCDRRGNKKDAMSVLDFAYDRLPRFFTDRTTYFEAMDELTYTKNEQFPCFPRAPDARESERGLETDENGMIVCHPMMKRTLEDEWERRAPIRKAMIRSSERQLQQKSSSRLQVQRERGHDG